MAKKRVSPKTKQQHPVFTIRFTEGLATRNRLPVEHVIRVLTEVKGMLEAAGKQVLRDRGVDEPSPDFGLELVGGFQKGSVKAAMLITRNTDAGVVAARQVLSTVTLLNNQPKRRRQTLAAPADYDPRVVMRLGNISKVQEIDKTRLEIGLRTGGRRMEKAVFDRQTTQVLKKLREPNFAIESLTIYGKLRELRDRYDEGQEEKKAFFGELVGDDGNIWRIEFKPGDVARASALFRKQVYVTGNAMHYKALNPKIVAVDFGEDTERDYAAAFEEMYGASQEFKGTNLKTLIRELETE